MFESLDVESIKIDSNIKTGHLFNVALKVDQEQKLWGIQLQKMYLKQYKREPAYFFSLKNGKKVYNISFRLNNVLRKDFGYGRYNFFSNSTRKVRHFNFRALNV